MKTQKKSKIKDLPAGKKAKAVKGGIAFKPGTKLALNPQPLPPGRD